MYKKHLWLMLKFMPTMHAPGADGREGHVPETHTFMPEPVLTEKP